MSSKQRYQCSACTRVFNTETTVDAHIARMLAKGYCYGAPRPADYRDSCTECAMTFETMTAMYKHRSSVHPATRKVHTCDACAFTAKHSNQVSRHRRRVHEQPSGAARMPFTFEIEPSAPLCAPVKKDKYERRERHLTAVPLSVVGPEGTRSIEDALTTDAHAMLAPTAADIAASFTPLPVRRRTVASHDAVAVSKHARRSTVKTRVPRMAKQPKEMLETEIKPRMEAPIYACERCDHKCARINDLRRHVRTEHRTPKTYACSRCAHVSRTVLGQRHHHSTEHTRAGVASREAFLIESITSTYEQSLM